MAEPSPYYYVHDLNPFAVDLEWLQLPWYWLVYILGFFWTWFITRYFAKRYELMEDKVLSDLLILAWFMLLLMGRLFYILFYYPSYYFENPGNVFAIWEGGMSFHGGLFGVLLAGIIFQQKKKISSALVFTDLISLALPIILFFGRLANFLNQELAGRVTTVSWAVIYPRYEDQLPRHPSQIYQALTEGLLLGLVLWMRRDDLRVKGRLSSLFLAGYGSVRFFVEFFREPDPQLGLFFGWMSMGQILCLLMVLVAVAIHRYNHSKNHK